jgi:AraC-like DNA-binding protein
LCPFAYFLEWDEGISIFYRFGRIVGFLLGPLVYFYVRSSLQKGFQLRPILWLHFLPAVLDFLVFQIPLIMLNPEMKIDLFRNFMETRIFRSSFENPSIPLLKTIHAIVYGIISTRVILQYRKHLTETTSHIDAAFHRWLLIFCSFLIYPFFILLVFVLSKGEAINLNFLFFGFVFYVLAVFASTLLKPELFHAFPHQMLIPDSTEEKIQKYESSKLQIDQKEKYLQILLDHIDKEKPYLSQELTLANLAEQIKIPTHYLSQIINEKMNCTFLDFVNSYRVEEAKKKLADDKSKQFTILSIAYDAGFNSKSTFYTAFKKHAGMTPSSFRKGLVMI